MSVFGRLNALAQSAFSGFASTTTRLDDWDPNGAPERTDYEALWKEATSPVHPIVDERIRLRVREQNTDNRNACREQPVTGQLIALDASVKAALLVETLKRFMFLDYCVAMMLNQGNAAVTKLDRFGVPRDAIIALESDVEWLARGLLGMKPKLSAEQIATLARIVGFLASDGPSSFTMKNFTYAVTPLLCEDGTGKEIRQAALERLFHRLGEGQLLRGYPDPGVMQLIEALARATGIPPETHPILRAKLHAAALVTDSQQAVVKLVGPRLAPFFETAFKENVFGTYARNYVKSKADMSAIEALSPRDRALALFDCLRVFNFMSHWGAARYAKAWPEAKLTSFASADYPRMSEYSEQSHSWMILTELFQQVARRKLDLDDDMLSELLRVLHSNAAEHIVRSLQVVKIVETFAKESSSERVRGELEATIAWLNGTDDHYTKKFAAGALHRLEKALASMAAGGREANANAEPQQAPVPPVPGDFGRHAVAPMHDPVATNWPDLVRSPEESRLDPPRSKHRLDRSMPAVRDFYGDLGDLRKCTAEHIAFLDELIESDANPEADHRRAVEAQVAELRAGGIPEEQARQGAALFGLRGPSPRGQYREVLERTKSRVAMVAGLSPQSRSIWPVFHDHARMLYGKSKPAAAWLKTAYTILGAIPADEQIALVTTVLSAYPCSRAPCPTDDAVRGLIYTAVRLPAEEVATAIADFARKECFQTVPGAGIRDVRMGNACLWTLINMPEGRGVPYLARLLNKIKYPSVKKTINAALDEAAAKVGMSRGALDELSVPTHDLEDGRLEIAVGPDGGAAILRIVGSADVEVSFKRPDGKDSASVPAALKPHKRDIVQARATAKEIEADLTTQIARLQRLWLEKRDWSFAEWDARYATHPLLAHLTSRLIWMVGDGGRATSAVLVGGGLHDVDGKPVAAAESRVSLWHPIGRPVPEVLAWRKRLAELEIVQPLKQAHREVYYVTDAERATGIYSNRFAGHILRQHQMMTLARLNNWNVTHRIWADVRNDEPTNLAIPAWNIVAEFWTQGAGGDTPEVADSAAYLFISTDQVRFYAIAEGAEAASTARGPTRGEAMRMEAVPEIVFSEVMRHCDLFTSVASVANDPTWVDAGADAAHPDQWRRTVAEGYWRDTAFGDLTQTAQSRKEALQEILPALKIADRCSFEGKYLRVKGQIREYKIHIGSGNILMEPDNRYLCIVRASASGDRVMLPFEGDSMLSTIISKAILLAKDDKIKDEIIVRQIFR